MSDQARGNKQDGKYPSIKPYHPIYDIVEKYGSKLWNWVESKFQGDEEEGKKPDYEDFRQRPWDYETVDELRDHVREGVESGDIPREALEEMEGLDDPNRTAEGNFNPEGRRDANQSGTPQRSSDTAVNTHDPDLYGEARPESMLDTAQEETSDPFAETEEETLPDDSVTDYDEMPNLRDSLPDPDETGTYFSYDPSKENPEHSGIKEVQRALESMNFDIGEDGADGFLGPNTSQAIKEFQNIAGLEETGNIDEETVKALERNRGNSVLGGR